MAGSVREGGEEDGGLKSNGVEGSEGIKGIDGRPNAAHPSIPLIPSTPSIPLNLLVQRLRALQVPVDRAAGFLQ